MLFTSPESARLVSEEIENNFQPVAQSLDALKERPPRIQSSISERWIRNVEPFNSNDSRALLGARCKHLKLSATHFYFAKEFLKPPQFFKSISSNEALSGALSRWSSVSKR